jgi:hypothetical protein
MRNDTKVLQVLFIQSMLIDKLEVIISYEKSVIGNCIYFRSSIYKCVAFKHIAKLLYFMDCSQSA